MADRGETFDEFVARAAAPLARTAVLLTGDRHLAEDLVQTALAKAYLRWARIDDPDAYVRRVLTTTYVTWWRRRWRGEQPAETVPDTGRSDDHSGIDVRGPLYAVLRELPRRQRAVVVLRYFEDLSEAETALALGCSVGTVKSQHARAMARLRGSAALATLAPADTGVVR